ncbi:hypothetical protein JCGZ_26658 [Jatropha curcas]|uniref:Uncharacterized protein n=2 Tax=Jatropha curcas TaxID=180498 RepID=A0A067LF36_JATCU|nr:hypothetical protein JCGZ_26658 [Jatropha curcas]
MGANGSKILVTTRNNQVASIVGTVPAYELSGLSHDLCMTLFTKLAFKEGKEKNYRSLLEIGHEIVKKCGGVPLAVKTLASLLFMRTEESFWKFIRDNELWKLEQKENDILPALRLSYEQLPSELKRCFAYCSLYTKDHRYSDIELVQVWMAHGLVQSMDENEELEDVGMGYFKELASKCFFQDFDEKFGFIWCKMHDLFHDLALSITQNEYSIITSTTRHISKNVRHLLFPDTASLPEDLSVILHGLYRVRTIVFMSEEKDLNGKLMLDLNSSRFPYLRMLDLSHLTLEVPLQRISTLKHLRLFHLHGNSRIIKVPNSICKLQNLQALFLCQGIEEVPNNIRYLISLRFLEITTKEKQLPNNGLGCLKSLRFLLFFGCENLEYLFEDMQGLHHLRFLLINECKSLISVPRAMKYLVALKTLCICNCENLDLTIEEGNANEELSAFSLQKLIIVGLPKLVNFPHWLLEGSNYSLQLLHLEDCDNLRELPVCFQNIVSLQELRIQNCGKLRERCELKEGQDWSEIAHIPEVIIDGNNIQSPHDDNDD